MVDPETYIQDGLKIVKNLIKQGDLQTALNACQELLRINPYHKDVQGFLQKIENLIMSRNQEKVDADIDATMHLWKEGKLAELMQIYTRLYQYAPQHSRLRGLIEKLSSAMGKDDQKKRSDFTEQALVVIEKLMQEKNYVDALEACNELLALDPLNKRAAGYSQKVKDSIIDQRLKENEKLYDSADFDRALHFYDSLLAIDPNNGRVQTLAAQAKKSMSEQKVLASRIHLNESITRMQDLFKNADYEKVIQSCEEILRLDPKNFTASFFRKKAITTIRTEVETSVTKKLKEAWAGMAPLYQQNPSAFARV